MCNIIDCFFFNDTLEERVINFLNENLVRYLSFKFAHHVFEITVVVSSIHIYIYIDVEIKGERK